MKLLETCFVVVQPAWPDKCKRNALDPDLIDIIRVQATILRLLTLLTVDADHFTGRSDSRSASAAFGSRTITINPTVTSAITAASTSKVAA